MARGLQEINVDQLVEILDARVVAGPRNVTFMGISTDSRVVRSGQLFWALKGERFDGHDFVGQAIGSGAQGAVVQDDRAREFSRQGATILAVKDTLHALGQLAQWWRKRHLAKVGAITGSVGKTTTKEIAAGVLALRHETLKTEGNFNNLIGLPLTLFRLDERHGRAVVELGMNRPGEIARLTQIADPDVGVITEVGIAHLEGLGSLPGVARAKLEMAQEMRGNTELIINGDNAMLRDMAAEYGRKIVTFGLGEHNDIRAVSVAKLNANTTGFRLVYGGQEAEVLLRVPGIHNVMNALAAAGLCIGMGEDLEVIAEGISLFSGMKGRFEVINLKGGVTLVDDTYNANPASLKAALETVKNMVRAENSLIIGLGQMLELGDEAEKAHEEAGKWVGGLRPKLFVCLGEHGEYMALGAQHSGLSKERIMIVEGIEEMARAIETNVEPGDVILLKGSRMVQLDKVGELITRDLGVS